MAEGHKDYSGTPLWKKLGIREGSRLVFAGASDGFAEVLSGLAPLPHAVEVMARATRGLDVAVLFVTRRREMQRRFSTLQKALEPNGKLWVAWPKKASEVSTDLTFELVQRHGLDHGMVDNKSAAITEVFQGLQFVYRVADRPGR